MTHDELKALLDEIVELKFQFNGFYDEKPVRPVPHPPAPAADLNGLESRLRKRGVGMPPSYRMLLSICDGIEFFFDDPDLSLLSAHRVALSAKDAPADGFPHFEKFVIATGNTSEFVSFDSATGKGDGEMEVVHVTTHGDEERHDSLIQFLLDYREYLNNVIGLQRADRDQLADD